MKRRRSYPPRGGAEYHQIWRVIDGAVRDCFAHHPEYIAGNRSERVVRLSIVKRVTGAITSYTSHKLVKGRSGTGPAAN